MNPLRIKIDIGNASSLDMERVKYVFRTLLVRAGFPWHFVDDGAADADIYYGPQPEAAGAALRIAMSGECFASTKAPAACIEEKGIFFLVFNSGSSVRPIVDNQNGWVLVGNDIILSAYYLLTDRAAESLPVDRFNRHDVEKSFLYSMHLLHTPLVDQYAGLIRSCFSGTVEPYPLWPEGKQFAVAFSHDVDYPAMVKSIEILRYLKMNGSRSRLSVIRNVIGGKEHFWQFEQWAELEKQLSIKAAYYFCGYRDGSVARYLLKAPDPFYDVTGVRYKTVIRELSEQGHEIGMHASFNAFASEQQFRREKEAVEDAAGRKITGNRHHYFHMKPGAEAETAFLHDRIGLKYDTSMTFNRKAGFRNGTCLPYHLFNGITGDVAPPLQLPLAFLDDHMFSYRDEAYFGTYKKFLEMFLDNVRINNGLFMTDYHVRTFNNTFFPGWLGTFRHIMALLANAGSYYSDTPENIARHWAAREMVLQGMSREE